MTYATLSTGPNSILNTTIFNPATPHPTSFLHHHCPEYSSAAFPTLTERQNSYSPPRPPTHRHPANSVPHPSTHDVQNKTPKAHSAHSNRPPQNPPHALQYLRRQQQESAGVTYHFITAFYSLYLGAEYRYVLAHDWGTYAALSCRWGVHVAKGERDKTLVSPDPNAPRGLFVSVCLEIP